MSPAPYVAGLGLLALVRPRSGRYGTTFAYERAQLTGAPFRGSAFQTALNPGLVNGALDTAASWTTAGEVAIGAGQARLGEAGNANAHVAQQFLLGEGDRYLAFTVSEQELRGNGAGPNDAFEVALLNANSGESLLAANGLAGGDAVLNVQRHADGTLRERSGAAVHKRVNADGTTTYFLDLKRGVNGSVLAGTPALLSFDLIGFGENASHVALRDIRLVHDPLAFDDRVSTSEDGPLTLNALGNDLPGSAATPVLEILGQPAHGRVVLNADGTLSYHPAADYAGEDSFSYRYGVMEQGVDGSLRPVYSNSATVSVTVTPVNDAPTAPARLDGQIMAGKPYTFAPLAGSRDAEGDTLSARVGRAHQVGGGDLT